MAQLYIWSSVYNSFTTQAPLGYKRLTQANTKSLSERRRPRTEMRNPAFGIYTPAGIAVSQIDATYCEVDKKALKYLSSGPS